MIVVTFASGKKVCCRRIRPVASPMPGDGPDRTVAVLELGPDCEMAVWFDRISLVEAQAVAPVPQPPPPTWVPGEADYPNLGTTVITAADLERFSQGVRSLHSEVHGTKKGPPCPAFE